MMFVAWPVCDALRDRLDRIPARARVELGDPDEQRRDREADERRAVERAERVRVGLTRSAGSRCPTNALITGMKMTAEMTVATRTAR